MRVHFIGIGGIGMSAVAYVLQKLGHKISGSDLKDSNLIRRLAAGGAEISIGHKASNVKRGMDFVVYSPCIKSHNPEILKASSLNIPIVHRQKIISRLMHGKKGIAITGAHGKGTTTAFIGKILLEAGLDPTILVGAEVTDFDGNARLGKGDFFVLEADESDGSFAELESYYAVITNIDKEHLEYYKNIDNIIKTNRTFINNIRRDGLLFCLEGDEFIPAVLLDYEEEYKTFGFSPEADFSATNIRTEALTTTFDCVCDGKKLDAFQLNMPGEHNVLNALAAISIALKIGIDPAVIKKALADYKGALRRFEVKGECRNVMIIEDYAHHPTEIERTLQVCRDWNRGRIISVFQPHRFSRTKLLADDFARVFRLTDELILTDVYSAGETPMEGVSSKLILDGLKKSGKEKVCLLSKESIVEYLRPRLKKDDIILVLGAGDIGEISSDLLEMLRTDQ